MDEWGRDPRVKAMRKVFSAMEKSVNDLLEQLDISPFDHRIRGWLEQALAKYERAWAGASRQGISMDEKMAAAVYAHCLGTVIGTDGIKVPESRFTIDEDVKRLIGEVVK